MLVVILVIIIAGINWMILFLFLKLELAMNEFSQALIRLQDSVAKAVAKIDALAAGNDTALQAAAAQLNAASDTLDAKSV